MGWDINIRNKLNIYILEIFLGCYIILIFDIYIYLYMYVLKIRLDLFFFKPTLNIIL